METEILETRTSPIQNEESSLLSLLQKISMPDEVSDAVILCAKTGEETFPGVKSLTEHLLISVRNRDNGAWKIFPEEIFLATMGCFSRFVKEYHTSYGSYGYDRAFWTTRQAEAKLFRIGELEYELVEESSSLSMHIPSDARLEAELLNKSVAAAKDFFRKYYPEVDSDTILLDSWLLSPALKELLSPDSRIIRFQNAFDIDEVDPEPMDFLEWVYQLAGGQIESLTNQDKFERKIADGQLEQQGSNEQLRHQILNNSTESLWLKSLPENTTLQRNMKKYLMDGGKVGCAKGSLKRIFL